MQSIAIIFLFLLLSSCNHISRSGHYVKLQQGDTIESLSKEFGVNKAKILAANKDKVVKAGEVIFIPLNRGVFSRIKSQRVPAGVNHPKLESGEFLWPVPSSRKVSSHFGKRWGRPHEGIDIAAREGASILSISDGVVVYAGKGKGLTGYGNIIVISHRNGVFSVYAHNKKNYVNRGESVHRGQVIGEVGQTGRSTGPHLHFEIRYDGEALNPKQLYSLSK